MVDLERHAGSEARTLRGRPLRGKCEIALALVCLGLAACDRAPAETAAVAAEDLQSGRALSPVKLASLRLLPAAGVIPPPSLPAPAFERAPEPAPGYSIGTTGHGALVGGVPLPAAHASLKIRPVSRAREAYYGAPELVAMLTRAAERVAQGAPGSLLWVGDLSLLEGGTLAPHASHTSGRDADISFYLSRPDGTPEDGPAMRDVDHEGRVAGLLFDTARNWALVRALLEDPSVTPQWIFVASHLRERLLAFGKSTADAALVARAEAVLIQPRDSSPHADHFHVRVYCGLVERLQGCLDAAPFHAFAPRHEAALARWLDGLLPFLETPRLPETREAIERIVRMNATPAIPHLEALLAPGAPALEPGLAVLTRDALDFLRGRSTPTAWARWRAEDTLP